MGSGSSTWHPVFLSARANAIKRARHGSWSSRRPMELPPLPGAYPKPHDTRGAPVPLPARTAAPHQGCRCAKRTPAPGRSAFRGGRAKRSFADRTPKGTLGTSDPRGDASIDSGWTTGRLMTGKACILAPLNAGGQCPDVSAAERWLCCACHATVDRLCVHHYYALIVALKVALDRDCGCKITRSG